MKEIFKLSNTQDNADLINNLVLYFTLWVGHKKQEQ